MPFPSEETTPPVTKTNLVMGGKFRKLVFYRNRRRTTNRASGFASARVLRDARARRVAPEQRQHRVDGRRLAAFPRPAPAAAIITCAGLRPWRAAAALIAAPIASRVQSDRRELRVQLGQRRRGPIRSRARRPAPGPRRPAPHRSSARRRPFPTSGRYAVTQQRRDRAGRGTVPPDRGPRARERERGASPELRASGNRFMCSWFTHLQLVGVEAPRRRLTARQVEPGDELVAREDLVVAVRPAQAREIVDDRLGQDSRRRGIAGRRLAPWRLESLSPSGVSTVGRCA